MFSTACLTVSLVPNPLTPVTADGPLSRACLVLHDVCGAAGGLEMWDEGKPGAILLCCSNTP